jgi:NADPH-dependent 2,4-dienoyl-CoA reductase/sulfur reductase-like enzyme
MMMDTANVRWPDSLWAAVTPPGPDLPELVGTAEADVIVIGGGFTGLSTALHLREAGVNVAIVEAMEPGWGASGRNNGQVIPTLSRGLTRMTSWRSTVQRANVSSVGRYSGLNNKGGPLDRLCC